MKKIILIFTVFLFAACANPYKNSYRPSFEIQQIPEEERQYVVLLKDGESPILKEVAPDQDAISSMISKAKSLAPKRHPPHILHP